MFDLDYDTKYISVVIDFKYDSKSSKNIPNEIREAFMGIYPPKHPKGRGSPILRDINKLCNPNEEVIFPIHFSLIKKPVVINLPGVREYKLKNTAVGAIILYEYIGILDDYKSCCLKIYDFLKKKKDKPKWYLEITSIKLIIGYDLEDVTK